MSGRTTRYAVWGLLLTASLAFAGTAAACPVCFGDSDSPVVRGAELSILFMAVITYSLIFGGLILFLVLRRRVRRARQPSQGA